MRGICRCGCGAPTEIATRTRLGREEIKGQPKPFAPYHGRTITPSPVIQHGHASRGKTPTYLAWQAMRRRCLTSSAGNYAGYGGRGITICARWDAFEAFLEDMGEKPEWATGGLDRIDNDGDYEPSNCQWATRSQQQRNKRRRTHCHRGHVMDEANVYVSPGGQRQCRACNALRYAAKTRRTMS